MHVHIGQRPMLEFNDKQAWEGAWAVPGLDSCPKFLPWQKLDKLVFFLCHAPSPGKST